MTGTELNNCLYCYRAKLVRVIDGDTIELVVDLGMKVQSVQHVRIANINTPEIFGVPKDTEEYKKGMAAKERAEMLLNPYSDQRGQGHGYLFVKTQKDKTSFNRYVADVFIKWDVNSDEWINFGDLLVNEGLATRV